RPRSAAARTIAATSSSEKFGCRGSSSGERNPPEEAILITSAPARTTSRTFAVTPSIPSHRPSGMPGYATPQPGVPPLGSHGSLCPPVMPSMVTEICILGPTSTPSWIARLSPRSAPEASRTVVIPSASVRRRFSGIVKNWYENGRWRTASSSKSSYRIARWTWQSNKPGSRVLPVASTSSSPSSPGPTSRIRPPSTRTSASSGGEPDPSKTRPPRNTVRVIAPPRDSRSVKTADDLRRQTREVEPAAALHEVVGLPLPRPRQARVGPPRRVRAVVLEPDPVRRAEPVGIVRSHGGHPTTEPPGLDDEPSAKRRIVGGVQADVPAIHLQQVPLLRGRGLRSGEVTHVGDDERPLHPGRAPDDPERLREPRRPGGGRDPPVDARGRRRTRRRRGRCGGWWWGNGRGRARRLDWRHGRGRGRSGGPLARAPTRAARGQHEENGDQREGPEGSHTSSIGPGEDTVARVPW